MLHRSMVLYATPSWFLKIKESRMEGGFVNQIMLDASAEIVMNQLYLSKAITISLLLQ